MPWYVALAFLGYAAVLIWQITLTVEAGRRGIVLIPFLLLKLSVFYLALSYFDPMACELAETRIVAGGQPFLDHSS